MPPDHRLAQQAHELHTLLVNANEPGPYILVGHSFGARVARIYAAEYPHIEYSIWEHVMQISRFPEKMKLQINRYQPAKRIVRKNRYQTASQELSE